MHSSVAPSMTAGLTCFNWRKANMQTPKHTAFKNIIKSRKGQLSSFEEFRSHLNEFSDLSTE